MVRLHRRRLFNSYICIIIALLLLAVCLGITGCVSSSTLITTPTLTRVSSDFFTIAVLSDTQYYSKSYPTIFDQQTQWIVDNAQAQNIVFVIHVGDLVADYDKDNEWMNAQHSMGIIRDADIPFSVVPGNHDVNSSAGDTTFYDKYFPFTDFTQYNWYGSGQYPVKNQALSPNYPPDSNASNYETFSVLGQNFVILNLACTPDVLVNSDLYSWSNGILSHYSNHKAIIVTHGYIDTRGKYIANRNVSGVQIWNNIVKPNRNIVAVICGHSHGEYHASVTGEHGNIIENLLFNRQEEPQGGNGWLRLYKFYPQLNKVTATTYSPYLNTYDNSSSGKFDFNIHN